MTQHDFARPDRSLTELLSTWQAWSERDTLTRALAIAAANGNTDNTEILARALATEPVVQPLDALAANHELVHQLVRWQWHAVLAARKAGATWAQIAEATGTTARLARAGYLARIEQQEHYGLVDAKQLARYRAVLGPAIPLGKD